MQPLLQLWRIDQDPAIDGGVVDRDAVLGHHMLEVAVTRANQERQKRAEVFRRRGSWRHAEAVELATLEWVDCEPIGNIPPAEAEARYYEHLNELPMAA